MPPGKILRVKHLAIRALLGALAGGIVVSLIVILTTSSDPQFMVDALLIAGAGGVVSGALCGMATGLIGKDRLVSTPVAGIIIGVLVSIYGCILVGCAIAFYPIFPWPSPKPYPGAAVVLPARSPSTALDPIRPPRREPTSSSTSRPWPTQPTSTPSPTCPPELQPWVSQPLWAELDPSAFVPFLPLKEELQYQDYTIRIYEAFAPEKCCCGASLEILKGGQRIYAANGIVRFHANSWYDDKRGEERQVPIGQDMTGDGIPDLLVRQWSGGAHCCTTYRLFQLGEEFRLLGTIDAGDYDSQVADLDRDGTWEFTVHDWVISACSRWSCCCGPDPYVILHYENGSFHLVPELMRKPAPAAEELDRLAQKFIEFTGPGTLEGNAEFWDAVLDLIYTGHAELVTPFLDRVWPQDSARRDAFLEQVLQTLSQSLYWPEIKGVSAEWPWPEK